METSLPSFLGTSFDVQISQSPTFLIVIMQIPDCNFSIFRLVFYLLKQKTSLGNNLVTYKTGTKLFEKRNFLNVMFLLHYRKLLHYSYGQDS